MSKKIILFLSDLKESAAERIYTCPGDIQVTGTQTNEAPVKYLLRAYSDVSEVLCIVTPVAEPAHQALEKAVREQAPKVFVTAVPFADGADFTAEPLPQLMASVKKGDEILLDITGGLRDAVMQLLLVSRALSFSGIPTAGAVYANFGTCQIVDCSHLIGLFDLVGGMQELASFGSVKALRDYYKETAVPEIMALLDAMEGLHEDITLCRTGKLDRRIEAFNDAMEGAESCADPLIRALLPAFQSKFGKKLSVPGLIRWCVNSDMFQQALTIYKERIPAYILQERGDLVKIIPRERLSDRAAENLDRMMSQKKDYQTDGEAMFYLLTNLGRIWKWDRRYYDPENDIWIVDPGVLTLENLEELVAQSYYFIVSCPRDQLRDILMDYQYIRMLRNMINHANDQGTRGQEPMMDYLTRFDYKRLEESDVEDIRHALERGLKNLNPRSKKERRK